MRRLLSVSFLLSLLLLPGNLIPPNQPVQQTGLDPQVEAILAGMEPAERVGQLFLVTYFGTDIGPDSDVGRLISEYHVGGVVLLHENGNFTDSDDLPRQVYQLTTRLQQLAALRATLPEGVEDPEDDELAETQSPPLITPPDYVPLFIATEHEGSAWPHLSLLSGMTELPSNMAVGATWRPDYAEATGVVVGQELSALGINLLLGPVADVMETPQPTAPGDLGARVFGGEPAWVSEMTSAYVRGAHEGSAGRLAVVPRHFPGYGGADRLASDEIPTVRRSLDQLAQVDLRPFYAVTGMVSDPVAAADGLLVGHIRYQGFQGDNLRATTKPISLDPVALPGLMSHQAVSQWRADGGLLITDALGLEGVRRYYSQSEGIFPARSIARDAFSAGNDILYLGNFGSNPRTDQTSTIIDTIDFFVQQYDADPAFREQVDTSVRRVLRKKLDLYGDFALSSVMADEAALQNVGEAGNLTRNIARSALSLLEPAPDLLTAPERGEQIIIFTDTRPARQCPDCDESPLIPVDALRTSILQLYGPQATGIVNAGTVSAFSLEELANYLQFGPQPQESEDGEQGVDPLGVALSAADWIVFVMHDLDPDVPGAQVVRRFLADPRANPNARVVAFAMGAPYYLDSTEVSKLTAYYALYGYTTPFVDTAARALFQELPAQGAPSVSVPSIDYSILDATSPDRSQVITLTYSIQGVVQDGTPMPSTAQQGDTLVLRTGIIQDYNGHPVPDGTTVEFILNYSDEGVRTTQAQTNDGIAESMVVVEGPGELRITAVSGEARSSETVYLVVSETGSAEIDVLPPDITPTPSPTPTLEPPTPEPTPAVAPTLETESTQPPDAEVNNVDFGDLFLAVLGLLIIAGLILLFGTTTHDLNYGLLLALPAVVFGLLAYSYYALMLPGAGGWRAAVPNGWGASFATWGGALLGLLLTFGAIYAWDHWIVMALRNRQRRQRG